MDKPPSDETRREHEPAKTGNRSYPDRIPLPRSARETVELYRDKAAEGAIVIEDTGGPKLIVECEVEKDAAVMAALSL